MVQYFYVGGISELDFEWSHLLQGNVVSMQVFPRYWQIYKNDLFSSSVTERYIVVNAPSESQSPFLKSSISFLSFSQSLSLWT